MIEEYIADEVWNCTLKYIRMMRITKEKFFEGLRTGQSLKEYTKAIRELWNIDHKFMDNAIKELEEMVSKQDFKLFEQYGSEKITQRSIKLENTWKEYTPKDYQAYPINPNKDFEIIEQRYVNRHIKYYKNQLKVVDKVPDKESYLTTIVEKYDKIDKTIPYFSHKTGDIISYQTVATYNSMLYNWNLTHSAWNRTMYDSKVLGNNLFYLVAHPYACPHCMEYQGYVYAEDTPNSEEMIILRSYGKRGEYMKEDAIKGGVGHPNCKHNWTLYWSQEQIQDQKWNSSIWEEKYKTQQKLQSLDLEKSRLLSDRRIYKSLGDEGKVDDITSKIKAIREKKKELE